MLITDINFSEGIGRKTYVAADCSGFSAYGLLQSKEQSHTLMYTILYMHSSNNRLIAAVDILKTIIAGKIESRTQNSFDPQKRLLHKAVVRYFIFLKAAI